MIHTVFPLDICYFGPHTYNGTLGQSDLGLAALSIHNCGVLTLQPNDILLMLFLSKYHLSETTDCHGVSKGTGAGMLSALRSPGGVGNTPQSWFSWRGEPEPPGWPKPTSRARSVPSREKGSSQGWSQQGWHWAPPALTWALAVEQGGDSLIPRHDQVQLSILCHSHNCRAQVCKENKARCRGIFHLIKILRRIWMLIG